MSAFGGAAVIGCFHTEICDFHDLGAILGNKRRQSGFKKSLPGGDYPRPWSVTGRHGAGASQLTDQKSISRAARGTLAARRRPDLLASLNKLLAATNKCGGVGWANFSRCLHVIATTMRTRLWQLLWSHLLSAWLLYC